MSIFGSANSQQDKSNLEDTPTTRNVRRLGRFVARTLLWACVLLLLVRGIASYLNDGPRPASGTRATVTRPAAPAAPNGEVR